MRIRIVFSLCLGLSALWAVACSSPPSSEYTWNLPPGFSPPPDPPDNPTTAAKVKLGRYLFYDKRLSLKENVSCGTCHKQHLAFTDGEAVGTGTTGQKHIRSSMSIVNVGYLPTLTWANPLLTSLENQALVPLFGEEPTEMGLSGLQQLLYERLNKTDIYPDMFAEAFPEAEQPIHYRYIIRALGSFQRTMISGNARFDKWRRTKDDALLTTQEHQGRKLFFSKELSCFRCHGGRDLRDFVDEDQQLVKDVVFHNTGLYNVDGKGGFPAGNQGLVEVSTEKADIGKFRVPSLRNIALTAPYMHDGSIKTLREVIEHYARGGRLIKEGEHQGDGKLNPRKSELIKGFTITEDEKDALIAFLKTLTDQTFLNDPRFSDPFETQ
ncbi:MAG: di-heme enzyme [Deltaproteobacteria bacterium]|nr:di-heme enzyme [Deltaproteobacteria bacterium]|tara:strand:- start:1038 stop:2180 length:1143 start_codon:yes stop_codon:yes gene_type:complete